MRSGAITIVSPIDNGPADRAGILAGDVIKAIDGAPVSGQSLSEIIAKLRGPVGSKITLTVIGALHRRATKVNIVREVVHAQAIAADVYDNIARLTISRFNEQTSAELRAALKKIEAQARPADIKGYIFDLRDNAGGLLDAAIAFADDFLDSGVIAKIKARDVETESFVAKPGDLISGKPIAVLINGGTAAGAEIVAAALQANRRAIVIGTRSIGAGTIQTVIALGDGNGALRLTTSLVFTPSGVSLDSHGVTPDETVADPQAQAGSGASPNKVPPDAQLDAALTLLGRRQ
jgi:carboxyl-terminal processing protease